MKRRIVVVALLQNSRDEYLLCKMPPDRGVFPGQWGLPGGGMEDGEDMEAALRREVREEVGLDVVNFRPLFFYDDQRKKMLPGGVIEDIYMVYLLFECRVSGETPALNDEFCEWAWVPRERVPEFDLNPATITTFRRLAEHG